MTEPYTFASTICSKQKENKYMKTQETKIDPFRVGESRSNTNKILISD